MGRLSPEGVRIVKEALEAILANLRTKMYLEKTTIDEAKRRIGILANEGVTSGHHPGAVVGAIVFGSLLEGAKDGRSKELENALGVTQKSITELYRDLKIRIR